VKNSLSNYYFKAFPSANVIFAGIGVLLLVRVSHGPPYATYFDAFSQTAKDVGSIRDKHIEIFNRIERFFHRLEIYTGIAPTAAMRGIIVEIMVEVLTILATVTKEVKRGRLSKLLPHGFTFLD
jgi:hypothetical protein